MPVWGELIVSGNRELGVHPLQKSTVVIGRSSKADIKVVHHQISATHCQLIFNESNNRVVAIDKSSNGTLLRLNGASRKMTKSVEYEINDSDAIILVKTTTPEKTDEVWFEFRRVLSSLSGRENITPISASDEEVKQPVLAPSVQPDSPAAVEPKKEVAPSHPVIRDVTISNSGTISAHLGSPPPPPPPLQPAQPVIMPQAQPPDHIDDSIDSDLPDFDDVLRPTYTYVPSTVTHQPKKPDAPVTVVKVVQQASKRVAASSFGGDRSPLNSTGPSLAKKPAYVGTSTSTTACQSGACPPASTFSSYSAANLDDSDDFLPDIIPDFKAPPSVSELRTKPVSSVASSLSSQSTNKPAAPAMSAAERARKLMASSLPPDFLQSESATPAAEPAPAASSDAASSSTAAPKPSTSAPAGGNMEENLICTICQEIFHDPVNVVPCNHVFCGGCLSLWLDKSKECPQCRTRVEKCTEHHLIKNLCESFLQSNPDRKRTAEEVAMLDKQNTITKNKKPQNSPGKGLGRGQPAGGGMAGFLGGMFPGMNAAPHDDSDDSENSYYHEDSDDSDAHGSMFGLMLNAFFGRGGRGGARGARGARGGRGGRGGIASAVNNSTPGAPWGIICRQCPGGSLATAPPAAHTGGRGRGRGARGGASAVATPPIPPPAPINQTAPGGIPPPTSIPPYVCTANAHFVCRCCTERYPARDGQTGVPPLSCTMCHEKFCHLYWGCRSPSCTGCLGRINAFTASAHELEGGIAVQTNVVEAGFFATYLAEKSVSPQSVLQLGYQLMDLSALPGLPGSTKHSIVCRLCFKNRVLPEIAYAYRCQLTSSDLPAAVTIRPNCEWGKGCRSQNKVVHARKYNHICPPSNAAGTSQGASSSH